MSTHASKTHFLFSVVSQISLMIERSRLLENKNVWDNVTVPEMYGHSFNVLNISVHYLLL